MIKSAISCQSCQGQGYIFKGDDLYATAIACPSCSLNCKLCEGKGYLTSPDNEGRELISICQCHKISKKIKFFNKTKIPARFYQANLNLANNNITTLNTHYKKAKKFVEDFQYNNKGFLFLGKIGCGKTTIACAVLKELIFEKEIPCYFIEFIHLLDRAKSAYENQLSEVNLLEKLAAVPVLLIDELGKGKNTEWENTIIENLISRRYNSKKTTIFTSNYSVSSEKKRKTDSTEPQNLRQRISERSYSRVSEMCQFLELKGGDLRQQETQFDSSISIIS